MIAHRRCLPERASGGQAAGAGGRTLPAARAALEDFSAPPSSKDLLRSFGSAFDIYVAALSVTGLDGGLYRFEPERSVLTLRSAGDLRRALEDVLGGQPDLAHAAACICVVAD